MDKKQFGQLIEQLYEITDELENLSNRRPFTPDGHMVGSIGECLVADAYDGLELMPPSNEGYDALWKSDLKVEIKTTQGDRVAFRGPPPKTIVIQLNRDGSFDEIYNGPGELIWQILAGRPRPSNGQYQITLNRLRKLNQQVPPDQRIPRRTTTQGLDSP